MSVLFLNISILVSFKTCCALIRETNFTRLPAYDNLLPVDSTHYLSELTAAGYVQCGVECSAREPHCAGMLYNRDLTSCILLKSRLNSDLVNWKKLFFGWILVVSSDACQPGWSPFDGHCYYLNRTSAPYHRASATCQQHGGYLVETDSELENTWISQEFFNSSTSNWVWIGISDMVQNGKYRWTRPNMPVTFTAWRTGEPNGGSPRNCGGLGLSGIWNDMECDIFFNYICEMDC